MDWKILKMKISPDFCYFLHRSSKPRIYKDENRINSKVKSVQPHILFKNSMTKKNNSQTTCLYKRSAENRILIADITVTSQKQRRKIGEPNGWKGVAKLSTELPLHHDNRVSQGTQSVHTILCHMQSLMVHKWQSIHFP